jgi:hypothetical protein
MHLRGTIVSKPDNEMLYALAERLCPGDPTLREEVELAVTAPEQYLAQFAEPLSYRGIEEVLPELPWIALIDGLASRGRVAVIDWKEASDDIRDALDSLLGGDSFDWGWSEDEEVDEAPTEEFLRLVGDRLYRKGVSLAYLDEASDCYPLILIDSKTLNAAQGLAQRSGYGRIVPLRSEPGAAAE